MANICDNIVRVLANMDQILKAQKAGLDPLLEKRYRLFARLMRLSRALTTEQQIDLCKQILAINEEINRGIREHQRPRKTSHYHSPSGTVHSVRSTRRWLRRRRTPSSRYGT